MQAGRLRHFKGPEQNINYEPIKSKITFYYIFVFVNLFINTLISKITFLSIY